MANRRSIRQVRYRSTTAEIETRRASLKAIVAEIQPATVRQVFYAAVVRGLIEKTEAAYKHVVCADLVALRDSGAIPMHWIQDGTRRVRTPYTFGSLGSYLEVVAQYYRRSLWLPGDPVVQVWLEKDALAGVVEPVTDELDVSLCVARGFASLSLIHDAARHIVATEAPTAHVYFLGDFDPSGQAALDATERRLREYVGNACAIEFERLAVLPYQIETWSLPSRPTKDSDSRSPEFVRKALAFGLSGESVELDSIPPADLRALVRNAVERHVAPGRIAEIEEQEETDRDRLYLIVDDERAEAFRQRTEGLDDA